MTVSRQSTNNNRTTAPRGIQNAIFEAVPMHFPCSDVKLKSSCLLICKLASLLRHENAPIWQPCVSSLIQNRIAAYLPVPIHDIQITELPHLQWGVKDHMKFVILELALGMLGECILHTEQELLQLPLKVLATTIQPAAYSQNTVGSQSAYSQHTVIAQPSCSRHTASIQLAYSQHTVSMVHGAPEHLFRSPSPAVCANHGNAGWKKNSITRAGFVSLCEWEVFCCYGPPTLGLPVGPHSADPLH